MSEEVYQSPKSDLEGEDVGPAKRPIFVWIIFIFVCLGFLGLFFSYAMILGFVPIDAPLREYYDGMSVMDHIIMIGGYLYGFWAALQLFRLKKMAFYLYLGALPIQLLSAVYNMNNGYFKDFIEQQGSSMAASLAPGIIFSVLILGYVFYLKSRGVLR